MKSNQSSKNLISFMILMMLFVLQNAGYAAVPQTISYQGYLTDSGGNPIDVPKQLTFRIYNVATGGTPLWEEVHPGVPVNNGVYSVVLGSINPITLLFDGQYYLGVEVETDGEMTDRQELTSVPSAFNAEDADTVDGKHAADLGDIQGVTAGSGLTGGGATGTVTLNADTGYLQKRVGSSCPAGQSIRVISSTGTVTCEVDNDSGGDITGVTAGSGLTGGGTTGDVSISLSTPITIANGGTEATTVAGARVNLGVAQSGANADITSLSGLTTPLSTAQGGTGLDSSAASSGSLLYTSAPGTWSFLPIGTDGQVLKLSGGVPTWAAESASGGTVTQVNSGTGLTGGPITSSGTLAVDTSVVALLAAANTFSGSQTIETGAATTVGLLVRGTASQTENLQEWRKGTTLLTAIDAGGNFTGSAASAANAQLLDSLDSTDFAMIAGDNAFSGTQSFTGPAAFSNIVNFSSNVNVESGASLAVSSGADLNVSGSATLAAANITSATISGGSFANGTFSNGAFSGNFSGDGSGLSGIGRYRQANPIDGCHLVTDPLIKTVGIHCPDGSGGENLCVSNSHDSPVDCTQLSDPRCRTYCLDTVSQTTTTALMARPVIPSAGVVSSIVDNVLACHFKGSTLVTLNKNLVCNSGACTPGESVNLTSKRTAFIGVTNPSPMWQTLPGSTVGGSTGVDSAGNWVIQITATMSVLAPYSNATCFFINKINDDFLSNDNNLIRIRYDLPADLSTWGG